ncbi:serine hydrolase [Actinoplanes sp. Pm04-4]|uniref:Serine hydrolase n=1 Tax=Paractinoplanes pyxinae TaxID=2997416 RepID=A0ABT4AZP4_9ACTN|nr:serine hydrolase domain-containing protein [Actinoplanes pyxinae]MCY1139691.1 serine hydrolase [Actinoplanes pyxinae]
MRDRVRRTAELLGPKRDRVVVAAVAGDTVEIVGDADAVYEIGSITKVFTSLALARLTLAGVVALDEPLADLLPAAPPRIRLRDLATHTSGLPRLPTGMLLPALLRPGRPDPYAGCDAEFLLAALRRTRLKAPEFRYSNFGVGLLGLALSRRTGSGYDELLRPAGLDSTGVFLPPIQGHNARGKPVPPWNLADLAGAGGLRSTAADMVTFLRAQLAAEDEAIRFTRSVRHEINPYAWVHLGWMGRRLPGGREQLWHNGGTGGFCSFAGLEPARGVAVLALSNTARMMDGPALELLTAMGED